MRNHYFTAYAGNKRNEVELFEQLIDLTGVDTIVEPYAGSCALSYYLWTKHPHLKFILNDNNKHLKELYEICIDDDKKEKFEKLYKTKMEYINGTKELYDEVVKDNTLIAWFIAHKNYNIRAGLFPMGKQMKTTINLSEYPVYDFFRNANIVYTNIDAIDVYAQYKNSSNNLIILDPPYISTCNDFYLNQNMNIYEYLYHNKIENENAKIYLILEDIWIIKLLFSNNKKFEPYAKTYQGSKKKTSHIIITNKKDEPVLEVKQTKTKKNKKEKVIDV